MHHLWLDFHNSFSIPRLFLTSSSRNSSMQWYHCQKTWNTHRGNIKKVSLLKLEWSLHNIWHALFISLVVILPNFYNQHRSFLTTDLISTMSDKKITNSQTSWHLKNSGIRWINTCFYYFLFFFIYFFMFPFFSFCSIVRHQVVFHSSLCTVHISSILGCWMHLTSLTTITNNIQIINSMMTFNYQK